MVNDGVCYFCAFNKLWSMNGNAGHSELMRLLIYSGLNPHQQDQWHQTPLHLSCIKGDLAAVRELCELVR